MDSHEEETPEHSPMPESTQKAVKKATQKAVEKAESKQRAKNVTDTNKTTIIEFVRDNPCLFDLSDPNYKDISKRSKLWVQLGGKVGLSDAEVKSVWSSLRETYNKTKKRALGQSGASLSEVTVKWQFFTSMQFLDSCPDVRQTSTTISAAASDKSREGSTSKKPSVEEEDLSDEKSVYSFNSETPKAKRQRCSDPLEQAALDFFSRPRQPKQRSEDDVFAELLVIKMRNMEQDKKAYLQQRILALVDQQQQSGSSSLASQPLNTQLQPLGTYNFIEDRPSSNDSGSSFAMETAPPFVHPIPNYFNN